MTGAESNLREGRKEALKITAWGLGFIVAGVWFWLYLIGNPLHDLRLMRHAETAPGQIIGGWEDYDDGSAGQISWSHGVAYTFRLPGGREVRDGAKGQGRLSYLNGEYVEVEYDPIDPSISRIKGEGSQSLVEWLIRKVLLGAVVLVALTSPGVMLIRDGIKKFRAASANQASR